MKNIILAAVILLFSFSTSVSAQDFFGTASLSQLDSESSVLAGQLTIASSSDEIVTLELEDLYGNSYSHDVMLYTDGHFLMVVSNSDAPSAAIASATVAGGAGSASFATGIVFVDTDDLGEDWTPTVYDPNDPTTHSGCEWVAREIHNTLGGDATIVRIQSDSNTEIDQYPLEGSYRGHATGWFGHEVVVKDGRVYDNYTGRHGLPIDEYKELWKPFPPATDHHIEFGF